jgi:OOP family OmpA-OmpF porin
MHVLTFILLAATTQLTWLTPYPGSKQVGQTKVSQFDGSAPLKLQGRMTSAKGAIVKVTAEELAGDLKSQGHAPVYGILFDTNKADIKPESDAALKQVAALLQRNPLLKLYVVGHTDNVGQLAANVDLSKRRAAAIVDELITKYRIAVPRLVGEGVGPFAPVASNATEEGRAKNRRVELVAQ